MAFSAIRSRIVNNVKKFEFLGESHEKIIVASTVVCSATGAICGAVHNDTKQNIYLDTIERGFIGTGIGFYGSMLAPVIIPVAILSGVIGGTVHMYNTITCKK